jgi:hypothetical protein
VGERRRRGGWKAAAAVEDEVEAARRWAAAMGEEPKEGGSSGCRSDGRDNAEAGLFRCCCPPLEYESSRELGNGWSVNKILSDDFF